MVPSKVLIPPRQNQQVRIDRTARGWAGNDQTGMLLHGSLSFWDATASAGRQVFAFGLPGHGWNEGYFRS